jgi:hypothetical protein
MNRFWIVTMIVVLAVASHAIPQDGAEDPPGLMRAKVMSAQRVARAEVDTLVTTHRRNLLNLYISLVEKENQFAELAIHDVFDGSVVLEPPVIDTAYSRPHLARMARAVKASNDWSMHSIEMLAFCYRLDSMLDESVREYRRNQGPSLYLDAGIPDLARMARAVRAPREDDAIHDYQYQGPFLYDKAGIPVDIFGHIDWEAIRSSDDRAELEHLVEKADEQRQASSNLRQAESTKRRFVENVRSVCRPLLERLSKDDVGYVERIGAAIGADPAEMTRIRGWCSSIHSD